MCTAQESEAAAAGADGAAAPAAAGADGAPAAGAAASPQAAGDAAAAPAAAAGEQPQAAAAAQEKPAAGGAPTTYPGSRPLQKVIAEHKDVSKTIGTLNTVLLAFKPRLLEVLEVRQRPDQR